MPVDREGFHSTAGIPEVCERWTGGVRYRKMALRCGESGYISVSAESALSKTTHNRVEAVEELSRKTSSDSSSRELWLQRPSLALESSI